ncbi:MAG TPA: hypothetical protein VGS79_28215 [Puia sp.]|nr:hypothetical protein [Puia sp.]
MHNTRLYKLVRTGVMIALITSTAVACHYQAGEQYVDDNDVPGADSGTHRVSTTAMHSDSAAVKMDSTAIKSADSTSAKQPR